MLGAALVREQNSWGHRLQRCPRPRERSGPPRCLGKAEGGEGRVQPGGNRSRTLDLLMGGEEAPEPSSEHEENTNGHADKVCRAHAAATLFFHLYLYRGEVLHQAAKQHSRNTSHRFSESQIDTTPSVPAGGLGREMDKERKNAFFFFMHIFCFKVQN